MADTLTRERPEGPAGVPSIGYAVERIEDLRLITGRGEYVADINRPGQLWARVVRSQAAHGELKAIHTEDARRQVGVVEVVTAADVPGIERLRLPVRGHSGENSDLAFQAPLATDRVRYVGEPIAVVVAEDPYVAEDAAEQVWAEIDEIPAVLDPVEASSGRVPSLHEGVEANVVGDYRVRNGEPLETLFERADVVVKERIETNRHSAFPLETRGLVAEHAPATDRLTVWGPTKVKQIQLAALAQLLERDPATIRFVEPDVGGAFGVRGEFYAEDFLIPWLAVRLGRPVKWVEDRAESFVDSNHSREHVMELEVGATGDGRLLGLRATVWSSMGGYLRSTGLVVPECIAMHISGPYAWAGFAANVWAVATNKTPMGTYRGPGEVEATFGRERVIDLVAEELSINSAELRMRNLIEPTSLPIKIEMGGEHFDLEYESGDYPEQLEATLLESRYEENLGRARTARPDRLIGVGVACGLDESGHGPLEEARIVATGQGRFSCFIGLASGGQSTESTVAQLAASELGVEITSVDVDFRDTDEVKVGFGASASRQTVMGGSAIVLAVAELRRDAVQRGAQALGASVEEVELREYGVERAGTGELVSFDELRPTGTGTFEKSTFDFSFCAAVAVVEVERASGKVRVLDYTGSYDVGRVINPLTAKGQLDGALQQGIGGVLFEELVYDESGQPLSTSFMDYLMPTVAELPDPRSLVFEFPSKHNLLGAKGAAQNGIIASHAAIANAVANAIGSAASVVRLPLTPDRVRALVRATEGR